MIRVYEHTNRDNDTITAEDYGDGFVWLSIHPTGKIPGADVWLNDNAVHELRSVLARYDVKPSEEPAAVTVEAESALDPGRVEALLLAAEVAKDLRGEAGPFGGGAASHETVLGFALFLLGQINAPAAQQ